MERNRRDLLKALGLGLASVMPVSLLSRVSALAGQTKKKTSAASTRKVVVSNTFEDTLKKTKQGDHVAILRTAKITPEEKAAIAAVREIEANELKTVVQGHSGLWKMGPTGYFCGGGCGTPGGKCGTGSFCGFGCQELFGKGDAVIDPAGKLGLNVSALNKEKAFEATKKAMELGY